MKVVRWWYQSKCPECCPSWQLDMSLELNRIRVYFFETLTISLMNAFGM